MRRPTEQAGTSAGGGGAALGCRLINLAYPSSNKASSSDSFAPVVGWRREECQLKYNIIGYTPKDIGQPRPLFIVWTLSRGLMVTVLGLPCCPLVPNVGPG